MSAQQIDDQSFCQQARQAGITNAALIAENADPTTLLAALDQMVPNAPAAIHDDFATFVKLEHGILSTGGPDRPSPVSIGGPSARTALTHVQSYLRDICHLS
ncbi:MAG TPA: hypothetical protein VFB19_09470 [Mycobacterium sp.]|nr:hypothetical protein [Mycobacterium sp.]